MVEVVWTDAAADDFKEILSYICQHSGRYAVILRDRVGESLSSLSRFPKMGRILPEFPQSPYREVFVLDFRIVYRPENLSKLFIVSMTYARQNRQTIQPR